MEEPIRAVLVDLDDTLYPQATWLAEAWGAVSDAAARFGADARVVQDALHAIAAEGSDRGRIIDRALERCGLDIPVFPLVEAFRHCEVPVLSPYDGVLDALAMLHHRGIPVALVSDGDPVIQRSKLRSLRLDGAFDAIVFSDTFGREYRKPHPRSVSTALERVGVAPSSAVFIGDRPTKDVAAAVAAGVRAVRVRTGEYVEMPDIEGTWRTASGFAWAVAGLELAVRGEQARHSTDR